jgi:formate C-acetyltransferase
MARDSTASPRALRMKERLLSSPYEVDIERPRYFTAGWRKMEGASPCVQAAYALSETLARMTIRIDDDDLLVGVKTSKALSPVLDIERAGNYDFSFLRQRSTDPAAPKPYSISDKELRELEYEILPYWRGRSVRDRKLALWEQDGAYGGPTRYGPRSVRRIIKGHGGVRKALKTTYYAIEGDLKGAYQMRHVADTAQDMLPDMALLVLDMQGHIVPGYKRVFELGFHGIWAKAYEALGSLNEGETDYPQRKDFYESVIIAAKAVCDYSNRYARLAERMADSVQGARKRELVDIAERCRRVPADPPTSFMEAMQSLWMTQVVLSISYGVPDVLSPGRVDQYLYPFYKADVESGRVTREQALEVIEEYFVKIANVLLPPLPTANNNGQGLAGSNNLTLGGVDRDGEDATNEVSYLFLEALEDIKALSNNLSVRISRKTPRQFLTRAMETHRRGAGVAFYCDEVIVEQLQHDGYSLADARDYSIVGCVEPTSTGNNFSYTAGNGIMLTSVLEQALNEGCTLMTGWSRVGVATPPASTFRTFEDVQAAFVQQLSYNVTKLVRLAELKDRAHAETVPQPLLSSTIEGCLERGKDMTRGGARYNHGHVNGQALATVANSLAAIRWAVFEQRLLSMEELVGLLRRDFKGAEDIRQALLHKAPKYGNDDEQADELADWVAEVFCAEVRKHPCWRGGHYRSSLFSSGTQTVEGFACGASADGRLAGEAVSNGVSPTNGTEKNGTTATLKSAARNGKALLTDGTALNMRLSPMILNSDENVEKMASLVRAYFDLGGRHVQFTPFDTATLMDAQAHPEKYPDLVVKVSGYSAHFVDLPRQIQDDVIARTEFSDA